MTILKKLLNNNQGNHMKKALVTVVAIIALSLPFKVFPNSFSLMVSFSAFTKEISAISLWPDIFPQSGVGWYQNINDVYGEKLNLCSFDGDEEHETLVIGYANEAFREGYARRSPPDTVTSIEQLTGKLRAANNNKRVSARDFVGRNGIYSTHLERPSEDMKVIGRSGEMVNLHDPSGQPSIFDICDVFIGTNQEIELVREHVMNSFVLLRRSASYRVMRLHSLSSLQSENDMYQLEEFPPIQRSVLQNSWARNVKNLEDYNEYLFYDSFGVSEKQISDIRARGITSQEAKTSVLRRIKAVSYPKSEPIGQYILQFLTDVDEAGSDESAVALRNRALQTEREERTQRLAERRRASEARERQLAITHPYAAVLTCSPSGMTNHIRLDACFIPSRGSNHSRLRLTNEGRMQVFESMEVYTAGTRRNSGLHIDLSENFHIQAQNVASGLTLGIEITDRRTGEVVFVDRVGQFGSINIRN